ncbi:O-acetyl-ADP-ribose deacetylase [Lentibacillus cibarius]|uniref:O-acetyl-ADP-ribose deacetylase n=1 Tax=Lentibacillus cibarius TaxID=2583219 RepID=A0A549YGJ1_9BACI|nr:O-acetyl-ADP-ribose deacetylase [Lentibacillus cibarius]TMN22243.1 O-acetyl-ADP-ribose deacetylase [Lentibacillus cibarius]TRM11016.1 O-acetyl-ADP-ribose deacetylase [Lentibacillus cibarius]
MKTMIDGSTIELQIGDITKQRTDAIVNAANGTLLGGGGVDGAIHRAAGKELLAACKNVRQEELGGKELPTGEAVITRGYQLPATYVIHTVGPVWKGNGQHEEVLLANCYRNALQLAADYQVSSIAFPSIATGVYHFPVNKASRIALETIIHFLRGQAFERVVMTLFSEKDYEVYKTSLEEMIAK